MKNLLFTFVLSLFAFSSQVNAQCSSAKATNASYEETNTIVDIAVGSEDFSTLVAAVTAADLVETLNSAGPFTVFAPTNAAFAKLPEGTITTLLKPENKATLTKILTYHVIAGEFMAADVINAVSKAGGTLEIDAVSGDKLQIMVRDGKVMIKDETGNISTVAAADVDASNGVIHVIDTVIIPE
ncbi:MAG: fasciclin domain-containing protein [Eudoraea sp.]|nr:fasciclin domain-containing protein [Eudoraea sp.]